MKIACKVVDNDQDLIYVEVLLDNNVIRKQERKISDKVEDLARYIAELKGLKVEGSKQYVV